MTNVPVWISRGALVEHRYAEHNCEPPCSKTSQYHRTFITLSVSLRNDVDNPVFDGVALVGFYTRANVFLLDKQFVPFSSYNVFHFFYLFNSMAWHCEAMVFGLIWGSWPCISDRF